MNHEQTRIHKIQHSLDLGETTTFPLIVFFVHGHFAHACIISKTPIWDGSTLVGKFPTWSKKVVRGSDSMPLSKTISTIKKIGRNHEIRSKNHKKIADINISVVEARAGHVLQPFSKNPTTKNIKKNPTSKQWR